jgi:hypothetical protein
MVSLSFSYTLTATKGLFSNRSQISNLDVGRFPNGTLGEWILQKQVPGTNYKGKTKSAPDSVFSTPVKMDLVPFIFNAASW